MSINSSSSGQNIPNLNKNVVLHTSMGDIVLELYWDHAPKTCRNFWELTQRGYYDGCLVHRVISVLSLLISMRYSSMFVYE